MKDLSTLTEREWNSLVNREKRRAHRDTISLWRCAECGRMPPSHSLNSFGIESMDQIKAIQWCIDNRKVTPDILEEIKKDGGRITAAISIPENPHKVRFQTIWDI
jgi:hypothetical protein